MLFTTKALFSLIAVASSLSSALAWEVMAYQPALGGTATCTGGGVLVSGDDAVLDECHTLVNNSTIAVKIIANAVNRSFFFANACSFTFALDGQAVGVCVTHTNPTINAIIPF
ncbi:hypothetical protein C8R44DRAFT_94721 [Mycena epipterygia]|nr:hypothetical protein C8R44DRAFT_94721 [Mycena epipterygia]